MYSIYDIVIGPLAWISILLFLAGSIYKITSFLLLAKKSDPFVYEYWSWKYVLRSYAHWLVPFNTVRWQTKPVLTVFTFVFHICLVIVPLFLGAHIVMLEQYWDVSWPTLPNVVADWMTAIVIICCVFFIFRRLSAKEVAWITSPSDWFSLLTVLGTFLTGFMAYHQLADYQVVMILHILFGEAFLVMIPFTRVAHMLYAPLTRGYVASEFGAVRHCKDY